MKLYDALKNCIGWILKYLVILSSLHCSSCNIKWCHMCVMTSPNTRKDNFIPQLAAITCHNRLESAIRSIAVIFDIYHDTFARYLIRIGYLSWHWSIKFMCHWCDEIWWSRLAQHIFMNLQVNITHHYYFPTNQIVTKNWSRESKSNIIIQNITRCMTRIPHWFHWIFLSINYQVSMLYSSTTDRQQPDATNSISPIPIGSAHNYLFA